MEEKNFPVIKPGMGLDEVIKLLGDKYHSTSIDQSFIYQFEHPAGNYLVTFQDDKVVQVLMPQATPSPTPPAVPVSKPPLPPAEAKTDKKEAPKKSPVLLRYEREEKMKRFGNNVAKFVILNSLLAIFFAFTFGMLGPDQAGTYFIEVIVGGNVIFFLGKYLLKKLAWFSERGGWTNFISGILACVLLIVGLNIIDASRPPEPVSLAQKLLNSASAACNHTPIAGAAQYNNAPGLHPIVFVNLGSGWDDYSAGQFPSGWWPQSVNDTQLVACVSHDSKLFKSCQYGGFLQGKGTVELYTRTATVEVVAASTGQVILTTTLTGGDPGPCPATETFSSTDSAHKYYGSYVSIAEFKGSVQNIVNP